MNKIAEVSPVGWGGTTSAMKKHHPEIKNPWALCLSGDTDIKLVDGRIVAIKDLVKEYNSGAINYVYSYDKELKRIAVAKIENAFLSGEQQQVYEVTLDNGKTIKATPNHIWLSSDNKEIKTFQIYPGMSLKPVYFQFKNTSFLDGYERVFSNDTKKFVTHWLAAQYKYGNCRKKGYILHHCDFNKLNNSPENIEFMEISEHSKMHKSIYNPGLKAARAFWESDEGRARASEWGKEQVKKLASWKKNNEELHKKTLSSNGKKIGGTIGKQNLLKYAKSDASKIRAKTTLKIDGQKSKLRKICKDLLDKNLSVINENWEVARKKYYQGSRFDKIKKWYKNIDELIADTEEYYGMPCNHKVVSVCLLNKLYDVYDLTIEKYHNFALDAGVFVHNSWSMKKKGYKPHYKNDPKGTKSKKEPQKKEKYKSFHDWLVENNLT